VFDEHVAGRGLVSRSSDTIAKRFPTIEGPSSRLKTRVFGNGLLEVDAKDRLGDVVDGR